MKKFTILLIYDGKPGHLSQPLGLAQLLASRIEANSNINIITAKPRLKLLNRILRLAAQWLPTWLLGHLLVFYKIKTISNKPDLIISFGGNVNALNVTLSRIWACANIHIGNRYNIQPNFLSAHVTIKPAAYQNSVATVIPLSRVTCTTDQHYLKSAFPHHRIYWALLIGGRGAGSAYRWQRRGL